SRLTVRNRLTCLIALAARIRGLSCRAMSLYAGLNHSAISEILKTGRARPATLRKLARFLGLPELELFRIAYSDEDRDRGLPGTADGRWEPIPLAGADLRNARHVCALLRTADGYGGGALAHPRR